MRFLCSKTNISTRYHTKHIPNPFYMGITRDESFATDSLQRTNPERERQELVPQNKKNWFFDSFFLNINQKYGHVNKIYKRTELCLPSTYIDWVYNVLKDSANER